MNKYFKKQQKYLNACLNYWNCLGGWFLSSCSQPNISWNCSRRFPAHDKGIPGHAACTLRFFFFNYCFRKVNCVTCGQSQLKMIVQCLIVLSTLILGFYIFIFLLSFCVCLISDGLQFASGYQPLRRKSVDNYSKYPRSHSGMNLINK